ncbi:MAG: hypothetical protein HYY22_00245 [Thaumarchaeota archaeon]|nr:hypothetical protein [Nitrososphaerota archaeon]
MKFSSAKWILVAVGLCLLLGIAVVLFFTVNGGGREVISSGGVDGVLNGSVVELQVRSVRALYGVGDAVQVEGTVVAGAGAGAGAGGSVEIGVVDPEGRLWASDKVKLSSVAGNTSAFSASFRSVREDDPAGVYLIQAGLDGVRYNASFLVSTSSGLTAEVRGLRLQDAGGSGGNVRNRRVGDMLLVAGSVTNLAKVSSDLSFIVEMRNASGSLVESGYVGTVVSAGGEKVLTVGWPAKAEGVYTIYAYVQDDAQSRRIISNIATFTISVQK